MNLPARGSCVIVTSVGRGWEAGLELVAAAVNGMLLRSIEALPAVEPPVAGEEVMVGWGTEAGWCTGTATIAEWRPSGLVLNSPTDVGVHQRRAYFRVRVGIGVELWQMADDGPSASSAVSIDLSAGGVRCPIRERLAVGEEVGAVLDLPGYADIMTVAKVVDSTEREARLHFTQIREGDRARLVGFVNSAQTKALR